METWWKLNTNNDPSAAVRDFLQNLWLRNELNGMILPIYHAGTDLTPCLITDPRGLSSAEPFAPFIGSNAALMVAQAASEHPEARYAAVLRACEVRALVEINHRDPLSLEEWILIGVECLDSFPFTDFSWRIQRAGSLDALTRESLRFANQGGIAPYRFRQACQMCTQRMPDAVDLCIHLIGLPVRSVILITTRDEREVERLYLPLICNGSAAPADIAHHKDTLQQMVERKELCLRRKLQALNGDLPKNVESMVDMLANCSPCHQCLDVCPLCTAEHILPEAIQASSHDSLMHWLGACVYCGMCEEICPKCLPLTAIHYRVHQNLKPEAKAI